ncbi:hypothetical protein [Priestia megaterium]|uniref:hypothetical protein n=1 Tax=Priestia megaterium TaxID=1404 RepID=UPI0007623719|nr:hypothetical protein [Priestia megaterium]KWU59958.1 hypothetical protein AWX17_20120 [Priestia megaterium]
MVTKKFSFLFSFGATILTFLTLLLESIRLSTNSSRACKNIWLKCNGYSFPNSLNYHEMVEYSYRLFTILLVAIILVNFIVTFRNEYRKKTTLITLGLLSLFLVLLQLVAGLLNVRLGNLLMFTTLEMAFNLSLLICLIFFTIKLYKNTVRKSDDDNPISGQINLPAIELFICLYLNIILGVFFKQVHLNKENFRGYELEYIFEKPLVPDLLHFIHSMIAIVILLGSIYLFVVLRHTNLRITSMLLLSFVVFDSLLSFISYINELNAFFESVHTITSTISISLLGVIVAYLLFINNPKINVEIY